MDRRPLVILGPSGSGKSTIIKYLLDSYDYFTFSISHTTRKIREGEIEGKDYHFITKNEFLEKLRNKEMFEYEIFNDEFYGTSFSELEKRDKIIILDLGVEGVKQLKNNKINARYIAISISSENVLVERIKNRSGNALCAEDLEARMKTYKKFKNFISENIWDLKMEDLSVEESKMVICDFLGI